MTSTTFEVFDFISSFPLLEDLFLTDLRLEGGTLGRSAPSTSPKFTGSLYLSAMGGIHSAVRRLLDLPDGLRFTEITVSCTGQDFGSATDLVSGSPGTLKSLNLLCYFAVTPRGYFPDLSKATKLKDLMFLASSSNIHWIIAALQTVESKDLQQITVHLHAPTLSNSIEETDDGDWLDLDRLLVQFWIPHGIRPPLVYKPNVGGCDTRDRVAGLLPELTRRELIDLVEYSLPS